MYVASVRSSSPVGGRDRGTAPGNGVDRNVVALGTVSLVTDVSTEMVTAILPVYLMIGLGLSPFAVGVVGGLSIGATALLRLAGAAAADRSQRRKLMAGLGYAASAGAKLVLLAAGSSLALIGVALGGDRIGKGFRTAPRDALISLSSRPEALGASFGLHRAMDTVGALVGPLLAFVILWRLPGRYDAVFMLSFCIGLLGVVLLVLFVRDHRGVVPTSGAALVAVARLAARRDLRRIWLNAAMLGLASIGDSFVYLLLQRRLDVGISRFALLPVGTAAVFLGLALPLGRLADRVGRWRLFLLGHLLLAGCYVLLWSGLRGPFLLVGVLGAYGGYYAATDGVLMAISSQHLPEDLRTSGLALVQTATATATAVAAIVFGIGWTMIGPWAALEVAAGLLVVLVLAASVFRPGPVPVKEDRGWL